MSTDTETKVYEPAPTEVKLIGRSKRAMFFKQTSILDHNKLKFTDISLYSVTPWREADMISNWILRYYKGDQSPLRSVGSSIKITDATANVGGNAISFHLCGFGLVNAVENDKLTAKFLTNNLDAYGLATTNVHCCDYIVISEKLEQDVVFIDAPWGGSDYKKQKSLDLFLTGINVADICQQIIEKNRASLVALKVPANYNIIGLQTKLDGCTVTVRKVLRHNFHSYSMIFCHKSFSKKGTVRINF